jgi:hypothetical protein
MGHLTELCVGRKDQREVTYRALNSVVQPELRC